MVHITNTVEGENNLAEQEKKELQVEAEKVCAQVDLLAW